VKQNQINRAAEEQNRTGLKQRRVQMWQTRVLVVVERSSDHGGFVHQILGRDVENSHKGNRITVFLSSLSLDLRA